MKLCLRQLAAALFLSSTFRLSAVILCVDINSTNPTPPYKDWTTAATNIQDAVDVANPGDLVLVTNGIYQTGGQVVYGAETNRVAVTKAVTVQSVNGPETTTISGGLATRCIYLGSNAVLSGFSLINGQTRISGGHKTNECSGGGVWGEASAIVTNCLISSNQASYYGGGGGAYGGTLYNCTVSANSSSGDAGGTYQSVLVNCLVLSNSTSRSGGGVYGGTLSNCLLSGNSAMSYGGGAYGATLSQCVLAANQAINAEGGGTAGGVLYDCTLSNNCANYYGGGGASGGILYNCRIIGNRSRTDGGGTYQSTAYNCLITSNYAERYGGGTGGGKLYNCVLSGNATGNRGGGVYGFSGTELYFCTVAGNSATNGDGGGVLYGTLYNCVVYFNTAASSPNWSSATLYRCCTVPAAYDTITNDPLFVDAAGGDFRLTCASPCIDAAGYAYPPVCTNDIRGVARPWDGNGDGTLSKDIGAYEFNPAADATVSIRCGIPLTGVAANYPVSFVAQVGGCPAWFWWDFGDGVVLTNQSLTRHGWSTPGQYTVRLSACYPGLGWTSTATTQVVVVTQPVFYVDVNNKNSAYPFTNWSTAATDIQAAVGADTTLGRLVLVADGVYRATGLAVNGSMRNSLALTNPVVVQSVNGPSLTTICPEGPQQRCAYVGTDAILSGFTLTNGSSLTTGDVWRDRSGGGLWCETGGTVSNCWIVGNQANAHGGGAYQGIFFNCSFTSNSVGYGGGFSAQGGAVFGATLSNCLLLANSAINADSAGGGAAQSSLFNCSVLSNAAAAYGGGVYLGAARSCTIIANSARFGGAACSNTLWNCAVTANRASMGGGVYGGTLYSCTVANNFATNGVGGCLTFESLFNSIVYHNTRGGNPDNWASGTFWNCCTYPQPFWGAHNITNEPGVVDPSGSNLRLQANSPCINSGDNAYVFQSTDLDRDPRIKGGMVDIGAYEYQTPASVISYFWLQQYGLPTDGSADSSDADFDGMSNWQEWRCATNPTNALSALTVLSASNSASGTSISWQSVSGINYYLQRSTNLAAKPSFITVATNIAGLVGTTTFLDQAAIGPGPFYYRVGVQ